MGRQVFYLFVIFQIIQGNDDEVKIRFDGESTRPISKPQNITRRSIMIRNIKSSFYTDEKICATVGSATGTLVANRLHQLGVLSESRHVAGHLALDFTNIVKLSVDLITKQLEQRTKCTYESIAAPAIALTERTLCDSKNKPIDVKTKMAGVFGEHGVSKCFDYFWWLASNHTAYKHDLKSYNFDATEPMSLIHDDCKLHSYHIKQIWEGSTRENLMRYVKQISHGVDKQVFLVFQAIVLSNVQPIEVAGPISPERLACFQAAVMGSVIAANVAKIVSNTANITKTRNIGRTYILQVFLMKYINAVTSRLQNFDKRMLFQVRTAALKLTLFWLINNAEFIQTTPLEDMTLITLGKIGLTKSFPTKYNLETKNSIKQNEKYYIFFDGVKEDLKGVLKQLKIIFPSENAKILFEKLTEETPASVSDELVKLVMEPVEMPSTLLDASGKPGYIPKLQEIMLEDTTTSGNEHEGFFYNTTQGNIYGSPLGTMPKPNEWFREDVPMIAATNDVNKALLGVLGIIVGSQTAEILHQFGLITTGDEPGYKGLEMLDIYQLIQSINQKFITKLMSTIPMSLDSGFNVLIAAFKTTKYALHIQNSPLDETVLTTKTFIPVCLKQFGLSQIFPEFRHMAVDLLSVVKSIDVLTLWAKSEIKVSINREISKRIELLSKERFPNLISDIITVFKTKVNDLNAYNLKHLEASLQYELSWDPPEVLLLIHEPPSMDGLRKWVPRTRETSKKVVQCPGHFLCVDLCRRPPCATYTCTSADPWCYFPEGVTCPGSIQCPVAWTIQEDPIICPGEEGCPVSNVRCPSHPQCPDSATTCPGHWNCPLEITCPGYACPHKYVTQPQYLLPCPSHPHCQSPQENQLLCANDVSCTYAESPDILNAIQEAAWNISQAIMKKEMSVNVNASSIATIEVAGGMLAGNGSTPEKKSAAATASVSTSKEEDSNIEH